MNGKTQRHPFLDGLAEDVTLVSSVLRHRVAGRDDVVKIVKAAGSLYVRQTPRFLGSIDDKTFLEYEAAFADGQIAAGLVAIARNAAGADRTGTSPSAHSKRC